MNDMPPSQQPPDDIDSFYRRASALDPSRPSDRTRQAVLAHAATVLEANKNPAGGPAAMEDERKAVKVASITAKPERRQRWWRPVVLGTLAAAGLAGLLALPQILTPHVASRTSSATAERSAPGASSTEPAAPTPRTARPPAAEPEEAPLAALAPAAPPAAEGPAPTQAAQDAARASARQREAVPREPLRSDLDSITVTAQRAAPAALNSGSPIASIAPADSAPKAPLGGASEAVKAQVGSPQALRLAAENGDLKRLQQFLDQMTDVNSRDNAGRTALLLATLHGQSKVVELLLAHGANPNIPDAEGVTPLNAAMAGNHSTIIRMLKRVGAR